MHFITNSYLFVSTLNVLCGKLCACMCVWGVRAVTYVCVCVCVCVYNYWLLQITCCGIDVCHILSEFVS